MPRESVIVKSIPPETPRCNGHALQIKRDPSCSTEIAVMPNISSKLHPALVPWYPRMTGPCWLTLTRGGSDCFHLICVDPVLLPSQSETQPLANLIFLAASLLYSRLTLGVTAIFPWPKVLQLFAEDAGLALMSLVFVRGAKPNLLFKQRLYCESGGAVPAREGLEWPSSLLCLKSIRIIPEEASRQIPATVVWNVEECVSMHVATSLVKTTVSFAE